MLKNKKVSQRMHVIIGISTQKVLEFYMFQTLSHHAI